MALGRHKCPARKITLWDQVSMPEINNHTPPRARAADRSVYGRTKVSNGNALLPGIDNRNLWVRRCRDIIGMHISDIGGVENASAAEQSIIRRSAVLTVELERLEAKFATAGEASAEELDIYARIAANLRRMLESIGLERRAKPVEGLDEYLAEKATAE